MVSGRHEALFFFLMMCLVGFLLSGFGMVFGPVHKWSDVWALLGLVAEFQDAKGEVVGNLC